MTLEQTADLALRAAAQDDLNAIREALNARAAAIGDLKLAACSEDLAARLSSAIDAGDEIGRALLAMKHRVGLENARLEQIRTGLAAGMGAAPSPEIDCRG